MNIEIDIVAQFSGTSEGAKKGWEKRHWYGLQNRPAGPGTIPKDPVEHGKHASFRHGSVAYDRQLTDKEVYDYELKPIRHDSEIPDLVKKIVEAMGDYADAYLEEGNEELLSEFLNQAESKKILGHVDLAKVIKELRSQSASRSKTEKL